MDTKEIKHRLQSIIELAKDDNGIDRAGLLRMLEGLESDIKEPVKVIECGYMGRSEDISGDGSIDGDGPRLFEKVFKSTYWRKGEEGDWEEGDLPLLKVTMIVEEDNA